VPQAYDEFEPPFPRTQVRTMVEVRTTEDRATLGMRRVLGGLVAAVEDGFE
jgi:hypothetical protein